MSHSLAIKDKDGKYQRFNVTLEVQLYVKQLETFVMHPEISKLLEVYKDRFSKAPNLLRQLEADLALFRYFCSGCSLHSARPCNCKFQMRIDALEYILGGTNFDSLSVESEIEYDFEGK